MPLWLWGVMELLVPVGCMHIYLAWHVGPLARRCWAGVTPYGQHADGHWYSVLAAACCVM